MRCLCRFLFLFFAFVLSPALASAEMVITYRQPESTDDPRYEYDNALLRLALEKTVEEYGAYKMVPSPVMNYSRAIHMAKNNTYENFFFKQSYDSSLTDKLGYAPIPVDRGIVGYRVFFVSEDNKAKLEDVKTLDDLKAHSLVQGRGWSDIKILREAGFKVHVISGYEDLFKDVQKGESVLFPRGANELLSEYEAYKDLKGLSYDERFILYYPLPRFFFTHESNTEALERVSMGLRKAWEDGSFVKLWEDQYMENIEFLKMGERTMFEIDNPLIEGLDEGYKAYIYDPFAVKVDAANMDAE